MAEVTDITEFSPAVPGLKCYICTASDGETLTCKGLDAVKSAQITAAADPSTGNPWGYTVSGNVLTLECSSASDVVISVWAVGY
jgi:hypothetical protein